MSDRSETLLFGLGLIAGLSLGGLIGVTAYLVGAAVVVMGLVIQEPRSGS